MDSESSGLNIKLESAKHGTEFVGLLFNGGDIEVTFPMGYHLKKTGLQELDAESLGDILNLVRLLSENSMDGTLLLVEGEKECFPIYDYMYVIEYYISHNLNYYKETETFYEVRDSGKVSWNKTIKCVKPTIANNKIIYMDLMRKYNGVADDDLITKINKYCVYAAFNLLGPLYPGFSVPKPIDEPGPDKSNWITFLNDKINHTNNDAKKRLFNAMIGILLNKSEHSESSVTSYGTEKFEVMWERMIKMVFGSRSENISSYYPTPKWKIEGITNAIDSKDLRPDAVYISRNKDVYIIDAKYYQYGIQSDLSDISLLPASSDINKQFTYTDYAHYKFQDKYNGDYNSVYFLPFDGTNDEPIKYIGEAICDWYSDRNYVLKAYLLDVKTLMDDYIKGKHVRIDEVKL